MPRPLTYPAVRTTAKALDVLICDASQGGFNLRLHHPGSAIHYAADLATALALAIDLAAWDIARLDQGEGA